MKDLRGNDDEVIHEMLKLVDYDLQIHEYNNDNPGSGELSELSPTSLWPVHDFVARVLRVKATGFVIEKIGDRTLIRETLPLGKRFNTFKNLVVLQPENAKFYGLVGLFFECAQEMQINPFLLSKAGHEYQKGKLGAELFNEFLDLIRSKALSEKYRRMVKDLKERMKRNFTSMRRYIDALFDEYSKLLVLRIDFGYHRYQGIPIALERILDDFQRLLNNRRQNSLFREMVGYIRRIEYGEDKRWHIHAILFFNGQELQNHSALAHLICEYWNRDITDNDGVAFNCNDSRNEYKYCGIGKIDNADIERRTHLLYALSYLTKKDEIIGFDVSGEHKMITKGVAPKRQRVKPGPKRKKMAQATALPEHSVMVPSTGGAV